MADHEPYALSNTIDWVCAAFFNSNLTQQIWTLPEETFFSQFVTTLNNAFETELVQEDDGYERVGVKVLTFPPLLHYKL